MRGWPLSAAVFRIRVCGSAEQCSDGLAVEAGASPSIRFDQRPTDQEGIVQHARKGRGRVDRSGIDLAGLDAGRGGIEPGGDGRVAEEAAQTLGGPWLRQQASGGDGMTRRLQHLLLARVRLAAGLLVKNDLSHDSASP